MEKKKAILKIEEFSTKSGKFILSVSDFSVRALIKSVVDLCVEKYGRYIQLEMCPPYRKRTTCKYGQNRHIWGHIQQIANETGNDIEDIEEYIKQKAIRRGYPTRQNALTGEIKPISMKVINTVEAGYLIDELHQLASELGIILQE